MINFLLIAVFLVLIIASGEVFLRGAFGIAKKLHISSFALGTSIISIGTASPDFFVSMISIANGYNDVSVGSLLGSGITNILLCIGIASFICTVRYSKQEKGVYFAMRYHFVFLLIFLILVIFSKGEINVFLSIYLICGSAFFLYCTLTMKEFETGVQEEYLCHGFKLSIFLFIIGMLGLYFFSELLLGYVIKTAILFEIEQKVIAGVLVALGTSMPEITTAVMASFKRQSNVVIGNVVGSNLLIIGMVLGISSLFGNFIGQKISLSLPILKMDLPFLIFVATIFFLMFRIKSSLGKILGLIFIFLYLLYILLQINFI
jgi:cation:H+ antiporter